jgi:hypothetical protein
MQLRIRSKRWRQQNYSTAIHTVPAPIAIPTSAEAYTDTSHQLITERHANPAVLVMYYCYDLQTRERESVCVCVCAFIIPMPDYH